MNADLIYPNVANFKEVIKVDINQFIMINGLEPGIDYWLVTNQAWELLTNRFTGYPLKGTYYLDEDRNFIVAEKSMAFKLIIRSEKGELDKNLFYIGYNTIPKIVFQTIIPDLDYEDYQDFIYLVNTKIKIQDFIDQLEDGSINGKRFGKKNDFDFDYLNVNNVIFVDLMKKNLDVKIEDKTEGKCYCCGEFTALNFNCPCEIAGYCSIYCKFSNYLFHFQICEEDSEFH